MDLKKPLTIVEQVEKLKKHRFIIENEDIVREYLKGNNYYRITGYALQFRLSENDSNVRDGVRFSEIIRLDDFDRELRTVLRAYIEKIELHFRTLIAYCFSLSKCTCPPYDQHYYERSYRKVQEFRDLKQRFSKDRKYYKDSLILKHHLKKYDDRLPLWAIVELLSFSDLSKYYSCLEDEDERIIAKAVGLDSGAVLSNHLHCLSVLRNRCAHAARLYNEAFNPPARFSKSFLKKHPTIKNDSLFAYFLILKMRLPSSDIRKEFEADLKALMARYDDVVDLSLIGFPSDWKSVI